MGNDSEFPSITKTLKAKRLELGWSLQHVGELIGTSASAVLYWELGKHSPLLMSLIRWCDALGYEIQLVEVEKSNEQSS